MVLLREFGYLSSQAMNKSAPVEANSVTQCMGCKIRKGKSKCVLCKLEEGEIRVGKSDADDVERFEASGSTRVKKSDKKDDSKVIDLLYISEAEEDREDEDFL